MWWSRESLDVRSSVYADDRTEGDEDPCPRQLVQPLAN